MSTCIPVILVYGDTFLQSVEEAECRRAYDCATEVYLSSFDRTKPADEVRVAMLESTS